MSLSLSSHLEVSTNVPRQFRTRGALERKGSLRSVNVAE